MDGSNDFRFFSNKMRVKELTQHRQFYKRPLNNPATQAQENKQSLSHRELQYGRYPMYMFVPTFQYSLQHNPG